jgi:hypothetical protein
MLGIKLYIKAFDLVNAFHVVDEITLIFLPEQYAAVIQVSKLMGIIVMIYIYLTNSLKYNYSQQEIN